MQKSPANLPLSFITTQQVCFRVAGMWDHIIHFTYYTFHWQDEGFLSGPPNYKGGLRVMTLVLRLMLELGLGLESGSGSGIQL